MVSSKAKLRIMGFPQRVLRILDVICSTTHSGNQEMKPAATFRIVLTRLYNTRCGFFPQGFLMNQLMSA